MSTITDEQPPLRDERIISHTKTPAVGDIRYWDGWGPPPHQSKDPGRIVDPYGPGTPRQYPPGIDAVKAANDLTAWVLLGALAWVPWLLVGWLLASVL